MEGCVDVQLVDGWRANGGDASIVLKNSTMDADGCGGRERLSG
jgi:hypothetical protein